MKYIITEEENKKLHILRRLPIFDECLERAIEFVNKQGVDNGHFKEYKSEVLWETLSLYEEEYGEIEDKELLEEFFEIVEDTFRSKIKKGYEEFLDSLP